MKRKSTRFKAAFAGLSVWLVLAAAASAGQSGAKAELAERIVSQLRSKKGIALDLGFGDAGLAIEIARRSELIVYCVEPDAQAVNSARAAIDQAGLYGTRVVARQGALDRLPCPDMCLNLIICGDEFVSGKRNRDFGEIHRLLSPNGIAFIGQGAAAKGEKLTKAALEGWVKAAGIATYEMIDAGGVWARITRPPLPGADEWSHRCQGPGNPHGSNDTAIKAPFRAQWINQATDTLGNSAVLVAGGRQFVLGYLREGHPTDTAPSIHAYDAYNGRLLWSREGVEELPINRDLGHYTPAYVSSDAVATEKSLYVLGGKTCTVFDADTGQAVRSFPVPDGPGTEKGDIWLYVAHADGLLFGAAGPSPRIAKPTRFGPMFARGTCRVVFALDPATGQVVWKHPARIMTNSLAVGGGRAYFLEDAPDAPMILHALDARTGKKLWSTGKRALPEGTIPKLLTYYKEKIWIAGWKAEWHNLYRDEGPLRAVPVFSAADGKHLFDAEFPVLDDEGKRADQEMLSFIAFAGDFALSQMGHHGALKVNVDVETGKARWAKRLEVASCGPIVATPRYAFGKTNWVDLETGKNQNHGALRTSCHVLAIPANGMVYVPGAGCVGCSFGFRGNMAYSHGSVGSADVGGERLVKGPAFGQGVGDGGKNAWVSWRNGPDRSGRTVERAATPLRKIWSAPMPDALTRAAASEGFVYVGGMDHKLYGLDAATGRKKWQYVAEGEIRIAPWLAGGRLYVGDDNGWVHCVRASDGALVWKFRAALAEELAPANGRLNSRWRAGCGVLVNDGTAYFTAGFYPVYGTAVYALDAQTGELKKRMDIRFTASGTLAMGNGLLYIPNQWDFAHALKIDDWTTVDIGARLRGGDPWGDDIMALGENVLVRSTDLRVVRANSYIDERGVLPIVTVDSVYLRDGRFMRGERRKSAENPDGLQPFPYRDTPIAIQFASKQEKPADTLYKPLWMNERFTPQTLRWEAWKDQPMTAVILAGDVLISGGAAKVYATQAISGKELWSEDVPGAVTDIAFHDGRLFVICRNPDVVVCFDSKGE